MLNYAETIVIKKDEMFAFEYLLKEFMVNVLRLAPKSIKINGIASECKFVNIKVTVHNPNNDFYFRLGYFDETSTIKEIIVARLGFKTPKKGFGTKLLKELCVFGKKFGYSFLSIECPNKDCQKFMLKLGFKSDQYKIEVQELLLLIDKRISLMN
ncbi:GNAT family N-acetyltransferase [Acinetobacter genomosp. 15BJ]|uniref:GNAT family N-acetyltransferase n=1 Tax=Acinetobacter genomosp. 15BJ TaxID=106651 RepID=A0ABT8USV3_9GAMM|nr:GNAT family N-acetyltransferase [Acinetobacter genomosp. 15BJ]MCH7291313.1 GNAT family N-acetyltransferase [Acinetobacter genomosp. 15BJ]MDO3656108.1 GNAT family N-acetyltransferase [Acinetobacter genomosp. 15BJ]